MRGDFSRIRFAPSRHYTAVLQQQGRVALDADQNEQAAIDGYLRGIELTDVVGRFGGPRLGGGFRISASDGTIRIGAGRYYVQGLLCENERILSYDNQAYLLNPSESASSLLTDLQNGTLSTVQVFLEVWQRFVTPLDDACLREPALGQADTTGRVQTVWRVIAEGTAPATSSTGGPTTGTAAGGTAPGRLTGFGAGAVRRFAAIESARRPIAAASEAVGRRLATPPSSAGGVEVGPPPGSVIVEPGFEPAALTPCCLEMYRSVLRRPAEGGRLSAQTSGGAADCTCEPTPPAGYRGLENQLYRVEIHRGGDETTATFKWSRENGSVVSAVTGISGANLTVDSLGPDPYLGFAPNQWVELTDDTYLFGPVPNQPGDLMQVQSVTPEELTITLGQTAPSFDPARNARVRRWDQFGQTAVPGGVPLAAGTWLTLESGIQIQFTAGHYASGDYWLIPARTASGQIDWPPCDSDGAAFQPALQTTVYRAPLACLHWDSANQQIVVDDCRLLFSPLTALTPPASPAALHVTKINWANDDIMTLDQLVANGLAVTLDQAVTGRVDASTFIVSLEYARPAKEFRPGGTPPTVQRAPDILDSQVTVQGQTITWQMPWLANSYAQVQTIEEIQQALLTGARFSLPARARVRLLGHMVYGSEGLSVIGRARAAGGTARGRPGASELAAAFTAAGPGARAVPTGTIAYLDGQTVGTAGTRADGSPRVDLQLPSGALAKASDFESWFYLAPWLTISGVAVQPSAVTVIRARGGGLVTVASLSAWAPETRYTAGTQVLGSGGQVLQAMSGGTSSAQEPQWSPTAGTTVRDARITWQVVAPPAVSPQGTVTFNYPPVTNAPIALSVSGGTAGIVSVPQSVTATPGQGTATFAVTVNGNPGPSTETYTITAAITPATGNPIMQSAQFAVTGF